MLTETIPGLMNLRRLKALFPRLHVKCANGGVDVRRWVSHLHCRCVLGWYVDAYPPSEIKDLKVQGNYDKDDMGRAMYRTSSFAGFSQEHFGISDSDHEMLFGANVHYSPTAVASRDVMAQELRIREQHLDQLIVEREERMEAEVAA